MNSSAIYVNDGKNEGKRLQLQNELIDFWSIFRPMLNSICQTRPERILDVGCGVGHDTIHLAIEFPEADLMGIDLSEQRLATAYENVKTRSGYDKMSSRITFYPADIFDVSADKVGRFDLIFVKYVLQYQKYLEGVLKHIGNLLRNDGIVIIADADGSIHSRFSFPDDETLHDYRTLLRIIENDYWDPITGRKLYTSLVRSGFKVEDILLHPFYFAGPRNNYNNPEALDIFIKGWEMRFENAMTTKREAMLHEYGTEAEARRRTLVPLEKWFRNEESFSYWTLFLIRASLKK